MTTNGNSMKSPPKNAEMKCLSIDAFHENMYMYKSVNRRDQVKVCKQTKTLESCDVIDEKCKNMEMKTKHNSTFVYALRFCAMFMLA